MATIESFTRGDKLQATAPALGIVSVTKADSDLTYGICRALNCGTAGTVNLMDAYGNIVTDYPLQQGINPISVRQVRTGGTASDIWALY